MWLHTSGQKCCVLYLYIDAVGSFYGSFSILLIISQSRQPSYHSQGSAVCGKASTSRWVCSTTSRLTSCSPRTRFSISKLLWNVYGILSQYIFILSSVVFYRHLHSSFWSFEVLYLVKCWICYVRPALKWKCQQWCDCKLAIHGSMFSIRDDSVFI